MKKSNHIHHFRLVCIIALSGPLVNCSSSEFTGQAKNKQQSQQKNLNACEKDCDEEEIREQDADSLGDTAQENGDDPLADSGTPSPEDSSMTDTTAAQDLIKKEGEITRVNISETGIRMDGIAKFCLDWKTGELSVQNLYTKYFASSVQFVVTKASGTTESLKLNAQGKLQLPGVWGEAVCGANPTKPTFKYLGRNNNPPAISVKNEVQKACVTVDDAEGDRPGQIELKGLDWNIQQCPSGG